MPNWVMNKVKFGSKEVMKNCYSKNENDEDIFDFNKVIEMPKSLHLTSGGSQNIAISYAISKKTEKEKEDIIKKLKEKDSGSIVWGSYYSKFFKDRNYTQEEYEREDKELKEIIKGKKKQEWNNVDYKGLGIKNLEDLGNAYINNVLEYGYDTWYDWSCAIWGTKWNSSGAYYIDENNIEFETAWSCPYGIFKEISKQYNTRVEVQYADEDMGYNCGTLIFENGEEVEYESGDLEFACEVWGYDYDEYVEEMECEQ